MGKKFRKTPQVWDVLPGSSLILLNIAQYRFDWWTCSSVRALRCVTLTEILHSSPGIVHCRYLHFGVLRGNIFVVLCIVSVQCREEGCIGKYTPRGPRDFPRAGILHPEGRVHCHESGCIGKYTSLGPRDFPRAGILHPTASGGVFSSWQ